MSIVSLETPLASTGEADRAATGALVVAIGEYAHHAPLANARAAAAVLVKTIDSSGYAELSLGCPLEGTSGPLATQVRDWFTSGHNDYLFFLWTGHGKKEGDGHFLLTHESPALNLDQTNSIGPDLIGKLVANSKANRVLVILDTCYAGAGADEALQTVSKVASAQSPSSGKRRGIGIIASSHALTKSLEGRLTGALRQILFDSNASVDRPPLSGPFGMLVH